MGTSQQKALTTDFTAIEHYYKQLTDSPIDFGESYPGSIVTKHRTNIL